MYIIIKVLYIFVVRKNIFRILDNGLPVLTNNMTWTAYHQLSDIYQWLIKTSLDNIQYVKPFTIGNSYEGIPILGMKISKKKGNKAIFIESNIHAIEWISSAVGTCFFEKLLYSKDEAIANLTQKYDFYYIPIVNPDGFHYSHTVVSKMKILL